MAKYIGRGTSLFWENPTDTWNEVECLQSVTPAGVEYDVSETDLCLNETTATVAETQPGDPAADEVSFTSLADPGSAEHSALESLANTRAIVNWRIHFSNGKRQVFAGYLRSYKGQAVTRREYLMIDGIIVRTGDITYEDIA